MTALHFIGVGGSGMSAVAQLWASRGAAVSGSDRKRSAYFEALEAAGLDVRVGHDPALVDNADVVVISSAVREENPELQRARQLGKQVWHRSEALAKAVAGTTLVAVAGSHGKTTTSAMTATALHGAGIDASFAVGARVFGVDGAVAGGYGGRSDVAVVEADESDGSFLRYSPTVGIVTNVEPDHLDHYGDVEALHRAFVAFARNCEVLVICVDDVGARLILEQVLNGDEPAPRVVTYGSGTEANVQVLAQSVVRGDRSFALTVPVPGIHNQLNAAAAWIAAVEVGADPASAAVALGGFAGTGRRFQLRGEVNNIRVIDDYAHHPTEVSALLAAARSTPDQRLVVLFQPALFSRTQDLAAEFGKSLSVPFADVVIAPVHGDREDPIPGVSSELIAKHVSLQDGQTMRLADSLESAAELAADAAVAGDLVLTVGSGTVTEAASWIVKRLEERFGV